MQVFGDWTFRTPLRPDNLHERGIVHLDVKPQNIMVSERGEVKIADFGISRSIREQLNRQREAQATSGTVCFMAPEQLRGAICDRRADIYATGIMFHVLLTGSFPFALTSTDSVVSWHIDPRHPIFDLGPALTRIIHQMVAVDLANRFATCAQVMNALAKVGFSNATLGVRVEDLPSDPDNDEAYFVYLARTNDSDKLKLGGPLPRSLRGLYDECMRLATLQGDLDVADFKARFTSVKTAVEECLRHTPHYAAVFTPVVERIERRIADELEPAEALGLANGRRYSGIIAGGLAVYVLAWMMGSGASFLVRALTLVSLVIGFHEISTYFPDLRKWSLLGGGQGATARRTTAC